MKSETVKAGTVKVETKGLLFDMDGVLISSIGSVVRCWRRWAAAYGIPDAENFEVPHGMRALEIIRSLRPDLDEAGVLEGVRLIEDMEIEDTGDLKVLPGVRRLLESIPPERWAIVTSATRRLLLGRLGVAGLPVPSRIISGDMVECGKPHPEPYMRGAALLGYRPIDCVVVEDAPSGAEAGAGAGCPVLGVLGTHAVEELSACTWVVRSLEELTVTPKANSLELEFVPVDGKI
ncbi:MAG TPA: HAD-IA family hydrolase [Granulicella sp.]|nr:HAD-IA family hydrolase [Granulicella sp.]